MSLCQQLAAAIEREDSLVADSFTSSLTLFGYTSVKPIQLEAVHELLSGRSVLVTVPTGYGKSFIYQVLPFCASSILNPSRSPGDVTTTVLVISPLVALMHDQVERLTAITGARPVYLSEEPSTQLQSDDKAWTHIFASPEALLNSRRGRQLLLSQELKQRLVTIAIDEAHCIVKW